MRSAPAALALGLAALTEANMAADPRVRTVGTAGFLARLHAAASSPSERSGA